MQESFMAIDSGRDKMDSLIFYSTLGNWYFIRDVIVVRLFDNLDPPFKNAFNQLLYVRIIFVKNSTSLSYLLKYLSTKILRISF